MFCFRLEMARAVSFSTTLPFLMFIKRARDGIVSINAHVCVRMVQSKELVWKEERAQLVEINPRTLEAACCRNAAYMCMSNRFLSVETEKPNSLLFPLQSCGLLLGGLPKNVRWNIWKRRLSDFHAFARMNLFSISWINFYNSFLLLSQRRIKWR